MVRVQGSAKSEAELVEQHNAALTAIRKAEEEEARLESAGKLEKRYRSKLYRCVACTDKPLRLMVRLYPPLCKFHNEVRCGAPSAQPRAIVARRALAKTKRRMDREQPLWRSGPNCEPAVTRARALAPPPPPPPECAICLDLLDDASPALACGHRFHAACVNELAACGDGNSTLVECPLCREQSRI